MQNVCLNIAAWNIHGIGKKLDIQEFVQRISSFDICFLLETWSTRNFSIPGKYVFCKKAVKKKKRSGRFSGGIAIIIDEKLRKGIKIIKETDYGIWIKLSKFHFKLEQHIFLCAVYLPPDNSPYNITSPFEKIENDILDLCNDGYPLLLGDMNARTAGLNDCTSRQT